MKNPQRKKVRRMRVWIDVGSHGGVFIFGNGRYEDLMHVYHKKVAPYLKPATLVYSLPKQ